MKLSDLPGPALVGGGGGGGGGRGALVCDASPHRQNVTGMFEDVLLQALTSQDGDQQEP